MITKAKSTSKTTTDVSEMTLFRVKYPIAHGARIYRQFACHRRVNPHKGVCYLLQTYIIIIAVYNHFINPLTEEYFVHEDFYCILAVHCSTCKHATQMIVPSSCKRNYTLSFRL